MYYFGPLSDWSGALARSDVKHDAPLEWQVARIMARLAALTSQFDAYREPVRQEPGC